MNKKNALAAMSPLRLTRKIIQLSCSGLHINITVLKVYLKEQYHEILEETKRTYEMS
jgi:hypothetical protein